MRMNPMSLCRRPIESPSDSIGAIRTKGVVL